MTTRGRKQSLADGRGFLRHALIGVEREFRTQLSTRRESITHPTALGDACEDNWIALLERYLPKRYRVAKAFAVDNLGHTTEQLDCLIFDAHFTPALFGKNQHLYVPAEAVYATFEIKQSVTAGHLAAAAKKARSVRELTRTSAPVPWMHGQNPARQPFPIMAGLLAFECPWVDGLEGKTFTKNFAALKGNSALDVVLTAEGSFCDTFSGAPLVAKGNGALIRGLFRLLAALREKATVVAIDWDRYEEVLS